MHESEPNGIADVTKLPPLDTASPTPAAHGPKSIFMTCQVLGKGFTSYDTLARGITIIILKTECFSLTQGNREESGSMTEI